MMSEWFLSRITAVGVFEGQQGGDLQSIWIFLIRKIP